jgi:hypothetical protein
MGKLIDVQGEPFKGGCITAVDKALLPMGAYSMMQNLRNTHPGFKSRGGVTDQHTTQHGSQYNVVRVETVFQFKKTRIDETHFYAQMDDGSILEATNPPPAITTGAFGALRTTVYTPGTTPAIPASWDVLADVLLLAAGGRQHILYAGTLSYVEKLIVFRQAVAGAIPDFPIGGYDFSNQVRDENDSTVASLNSLSTLANGHAIFVKTNVPANGFYLNVLSNNSNTSTMTVAYRSGAGTWTNLGTTDGTAIAGKSLGQSGTVTVSGGSSIVPTYLFGEVGFWYRISFDAALDATVSLKNVKYQSDWTTLNNSWNGIVNYAVEVQVQGEVATGEWYNYGSALVDVSELAAGKIMMVAFTDPVEGIFVDPGLTPIVTSMGVPYISYWNGETFVSVGATQDGTNGLSNPGWITFPKNAAQPMQWLTSGYNAYWYQVAWTVAFPVDTGLSFSGMPVFDINDFGAYGNAVVAWKNRACYTFDQYPAYIYVSAEGNPMVLNGTDYGILHAGDGRANRIVNLQKFHNELIAFQEEKGTAGGTVTLFEGYSPATFGKLVLSSKIGTMNAKSAVVVDGVMTSTKTDESLKTLCFFLSRYGVAATDGKTVSFISDDIANYFDPSKDECIRRGYENLMWLDYDAADNVLRLGLVSGASATRVNIFPVFDLVTKTWSFDTYATGISCMANIDSGSGAKPVMQVGGDVSRGKVMILNNNTNFDNGTGDIRTFLNIVLTHKGLNLVLREMAIRLQAMLAVTGVVPAVYPGYDNPLQITFVQDQKESEAVACQKDMTPEFSGQNSRRHYFTLNQVGNIVEIRIENSYNAYPMGLYDLGLKVDTWTQRQ